MREQRDGEGVTKREEGREGGLVLVVLRRLCWPTARAHLLVEARLQGGGGAGHERGRRGGGRRAPWMPWLGAAVTDADGRRTAAQQGHDGNDAGMEAATGISGGGARRVGRR